MEPPQNRQAVGEKNQSTASKQLYHSSWRGTLKTTTFIIRGEKAYLHRRFGPIIANSSLFLCVNENETEQGNSQPTIDTVKKLLFLSEKGDLTAAVQK